MKWLNKFVKGELDHKDSGFGNIIDAEIKYMLQSTISLRRSDFTDSIYMDEGTDSVLLVYTSAVEDQTQRLVATKFNELASKFA